MSIQVDKLEGELDRELKLNKILQCALQGPVQSCPCLSPVLPLQVQGLLAELAAVEEEITLLERKVDELKLSLYRERQQTQLGEGLQLLELQPQLSKEKRKHLLGREAERMEFRKFGSPTRLQSYSDYRNHRTSKERREFLRSSKDIRSMSLTMSNAGYITESSRSLENSLLEEEISSEKPNVLSEELIKCLIGIYIKLNQDTLGSGGSSMIPKHSLSCMNSKGFSKISFNCIVPTFPFDDDTLYLQPYGTLIGFDDSISSYGPYKNFIQITSNSLATNCISECYTAMKKLRFLMHKLCNVDLTFLTYQQKLAFWINIYNASIMHAYLQHGLPSTHEKLLTLMNKAAINVGGIVLNALAIEHFILRHPSDSVHSPTDEKETLVRHAYGLKYPEPNVTFALCRGSWSSPALRVYTGDEVVNELWRARQEYLEASVGVTSKKKIMVPKLLQWHMRDFADDMESLLEWIYSQLPQSASVKGLVGECLKSETKFPVTKKVEIQPYASEFRYLVPM
ncbi:hypothetical protein DCAR_0313220 [Daucus carota subsp. sativus]|uniref:DUF547 domain-containing protein n=1 Tax=Daucus carota subsp. sativus TaxID=79200 RepID=A0AAF1AUT5_DAUCS|nr:hypothetical protein DCAR_0313220 [Daucus carota subsp. sativus]